MKTYPMIAMCAALVLTFGMVAAPVNADPTPTGSVIYNGQLLAGTNFTPGANENPDVQVYLEDQGLTLSSGLFVDRIGPNFGNVFSGTTGTLAAGTQVTDYLFHYDFPGMGNGNQTSGTITFDAPILGLIIFSSSLNASDSTFAVPGVTYFSGQDRGLEKFINSPNGVDDFSVSGDSLTYNIDSWSTTDGIDEIRVITAVPEPSTALPALLAAGVVGVLWARRWRSAKVRC